MWNLKKYNKLIKGIRLTGRENRLVVTSREGRRGNVGMGGVGSTNYWVNIASRVYCMTWGIEIIFCSNSK